MDETQRILNGLARFYAAVDTGDWETAQALMTDPFHLDYSSYGGGAPASLSSATIIAGWREVLPGFDHTHHQLGNMEVQRDQDTAVVCCYVTATHVIDDRVWTVVGRYRNTCIAVDGDWKLSGSQFLFKYQSGDTSLPGIAQQRVEHP